MRALRAFILFFVLTLTAVAQAAPHGIFPTFQKRLVDSLKTVRSPVAASGVMYYGGPVISNVKVYAVFWGTGVDGEVTSRIGDFYKNATNSTYLDWLKEYDTNIKAQDGRQGTNQSIGRGTYISAIQITPKKTDASLQDSDIQTEIDGQIAAGVLPKPDDNTLYMVYFPPGITISIDGATSCQDFCAYHEGYVSKNFGNVFYGVMPDISGLCGQGCGYGSTQWYSATEISSHELMEAITDPFPTPGNTPAYPQAWNTSDAQEVGDLCVGGGTNLTTPGDTYALQEIWQNSINNCAPGPYQSP